MKSLQSPGQPELTESDREHLRRCVELAEEAVACGPNRSVRCSVLGAEDGTALGVEPGGVHGRPDQALRSRFGPWAAEDMGACVPRGRVASVRRPSGSAWLDAAWAALRRRDSRSDNSSLGRGRPRESA